jgi:hypothetical protein
VSSNGHLHRPDDDLVQATGNYTYLLSFILYNEFTLKIGEVVSTIPSEQITLVIVRSAELIKFFSNWLQCRDGSGTSLNVGFHFSSLPRTNLPSIRISSSKCGIWAANPAFGKPTSTLSRSRLCLHTTV